ncbi:MAG: FAD-dependent oxidoreductase [Rhizobiaceae bacterium]
MTRPLQSFGRANAATSRVLAPGEAVRLLESRKTGEDGLLAYGNGRSYGDTCQNVGGALIDMRAMNRVISFDPTIGILEAEAGVLLSDVISRFGGQGFFPPVVPGTQFVTLGGAVANDIHGKNHHRRGTFGRHVEWLTLLRSDGQTLKCSATENAGLFRATIGGMGLTGLILTAAVRLMPVASADVIEKATGFERLEDYFALAEKADHDNEYAVAWIDQLATGQHFGRGVLLTGNHATDDRRFKVSGRGVLSVPLQPPFTVLAKPFISVFNRAYRWSKLRSPGPKRSPWQSFFFPLDGVRDWNRLYGPNGLFQHQSAIPFETARDAIPELLSATHRAGQASFLTVLKRFGDIPSPAMLSFPRPGYTLTLDFANRGPATLTLLEELDRITVAAGGAVNPYKDARMSAATFEASFPNWRALEEYRDPAFMSDFWRRTAGALSLGGTQLAAAAE